MKAKPKLGPKPDRIKGNRSLSQLTRGMLGPLFRKQGFARQEIVTKWETIVGTSLGQYSHPERISFPRAARQGGTLFVRVEGSFALELQHRSVEILERINTYFGYGAVEKLVIKQGPLPRKVIKKRLAEPSLTKAQENQLDEVLDSTGDDRLRSALRGIGKQVLSDNADEQNPEGNRSDN
jgi:hypothetical protein